MNSLTPLISKLNLFNYSPETNTLYISLPKDLKICINNTIDLIVNDNLNITCSEFNLLSLFKNIHLDSYDAAIHLNSRRAKQLTDLDNYIELQISAVESFSQLLQNRLNKLEKLNKSICKIT